jgi:UV DNA damage endonuclease
LQNVKDLLKIVQWNNENGIKLFRISSDIFTWNSEYNIEDCPDYLEIADILAQVGREALKNNQRLTTHPGPFNVLASLNENTAKNSIDYLNKIGVWMDLIGLPKTPYAKINIHIGGAYGNKVEAIERFNENFKKLSYSTRSRLTVENDDKASMYSVYDLFYGVYSKINIPIVFDYHHHKFNTSGLTEEEALRLASLTWGNIKQCTHYSESMLEKENVEGKKPQAHSDFIYDKIEDYGLNIDCVVEAKKKDLAVSKYLREH